MTKLAAAVRNFVREEEGASGVEYALLVALIGVAFIVGSQKLGKSINDQLTTTAGTVASPPAAP